MAKQAIKKGSGTATSRKNSLSAWKESKGLNSDGNSKKQTLTLSNANKPMKWILMPEAFVDAVKLPGIPMNTTISIYGHSNVGKTTFLNHAIASAQQQGLIPVIIDTENAFSFQYARTMGLKCEPVYGEVEVEEVDPNTGEVSTTIKEEIINWDGDFLYFNTTLLAEMYGNYDYAKGTEVSKKRKVAVIEDVARCINELLDAQDNDEIQQGFLFVWDSVGSMISFKDFSAKSSNAMWAAAAMSTSFNNIVNDRIPSSRKISHKYDNTLLYVNKVWMDSMTSPTQSIMQPKGGKALHYATRLQFLLGGQLTSSTKRLTAVSKGLTYAFGIETKIKVLKNHLDAPFDVSYEGKMIVTDTGFIKPEDIDDYKKNHVVEILKQLNEQNHNENVDISDEDIEILEEEVED